MFPYYSKNSEPCTVISAAASRILVFFLIQKKAVNRAAEHLYEWEEWPLASNKNEKFVEFFVCVGGFVLLLQRPMNRATVEQSRFNR